MRRVVCKSVHVYLCASVCGYVGGVGVGDSEGRFLSRCAGLCSRARMLAHMCIYVREWGC